MAWTGWSLSWAPRDMPVWLFERFVGKDLTTMWRWLANHPAPADPAATAKLLDRVTTVESSWRSRSGVADDVALLAAAFAVLPVLYAAQPCVPPRLDHGPGPARAR